MSVTGTVTNGVVVLPPTTTLTEGQKVAITPLQELPPDDSFLRLVGSIPPGRFPDDFGVNLDYYLYGVTPKRQPRRGRWIAEHEPAAELSDAQTAEGARQFAQLAAETQNLPADLASNHDFYLHGQSKR